MNILLDNPDISCINDHITPDTLLVLDLDNTLIRSKTMLGSPQWLYHIVGEAMGSGMKREEAIDGLYELYLQILSFTDMVLIDKNLPEYFKNWHKSALGIICLTARHISTAKHTFSQLKYNDLNFTDLDLELELQPVVNMQQGILFASEFHKKGVVLDKFLKAASNDNLLQSPKRIVFVDDIPDNIHSIADMADENNLEFVGLRYSAEDQRVAAFNPLTAQIQLENLGKILPDKVATEFANVLGQRNKASLPSS